VSSITVVEVAPVTPVFLEPVGTGTSIPVVNVPVIDVIVPGLRGPKGDSGDAAAGYVHTQASPAAIWTANHNLGFNPTVSVRSVGGAEIEAEVVHTSLNQTLIYFTAAIPGTARFT
jgi:hypothetical protein